MRSSHMPAASLQMSFAAVPSCVNSSAARLGVHLHQGTEVTGIDVAGSGVRGVATSRGDIAAPVVLNATAGWSTLLLHAHWPKLIGFLDAIPVRGWTRLMPAHVARGRRGIGDAFVDAHLVA